PLGSQGRRITYPARKNGVTTATRERAKSGCCRGRAPSGLEGGRGQRVDDAVSVEAVLVRVPLAHVGGLLAVHVVDVRARIRAGHRRGRLVQILLHGGRVEGEALLAGLAEAADEDGGHAGGVRGGHRGAVEVLVVGTGAAGAVADDVGALGLAVGADAALGAQRLLGGGGEDGAGHRRAPAVERVAAGRGDVGLL